MTVLPKESAQLVGIQVDHYDDVDGWILTCDDCQHSWIVSTDEVSSEPGRWLCPNGCNGKAAA